MINLANFRSIRLSFVKINIEEKLLIFLSQILTIKYPSIRDITLSISLFQQTMAFAMVELMETTLTH